MISQSSLIVSLIVLCPCILAAQGELPNDSLAYTVDVECGGYGSGFFLRTDSNVYLVTARHVIFSEPQTTPPQQGQSKGSSPPVPRQLLCQLAGLDQHSAGQQDRRRRNWFMVDMKALMQNDEIKLSETADVATIHIGTIAPIAGTLPLSSPDSKEKPKPQWVNFVSGVELVEHVESLLAFRLESLQRWEQIATGDDIYVFGYPKSIGIPQNLQLDYNLPLVRKGIVAQEDNSPRNVVLDCLVFPGNSGGPVIKITHSQSKSAVLVIGIVTQYVPIQELWANALLKYTHYQVHNSGYSIAEPIDNVLELVSK